MPATVVLNATGPLPLKVTFPAPSDGPVSVFVSGSAYSATAARSVGVKVLFDTSIIGTSSVFCNAAQSHQTFVTTLLAGNLGGPGTHAVALIPATPDTQSDANDFYQVTLLY